MTLSKFALLIPVASVFLFSGCINNQENLDNPRSSQAESATPRTDLVTQTIVNSDGKEVELSSGELRIVKEKNATIRTAQTFDSVENSTLTLEENKVTVMSVVKDSTIIVKSGAVLEVPYIKNSKIIIEKNGDLRVSDRIKDTKILLEQGGFSLRPADIDDESVITEK